MDKELRLLIAVPNTGLMHADFVKSLMKLQEHLQKEGIRHDVEILAGTLVYMARDNLACKVINGNYTHILFIDSDMVFDGSTLEALTFSGKDFICGVFQSRRPPYGSCIYKSLQPLKRVQEFGLEPFRVAGCGMAFTMISAAILTRVQIKHGTCFSPDIFDGVKFGEDLAFCKRAADLGFEIWCEPTARVGHIANVTIWPGEPPAT